MSIFDPLFQWLGYILAGIAISVALVGMFIQHLADETENEE